MATYQIVVNREPPLLQSIMWIECDSDEIALRAAGETLNLNEVGWIMEGNRRVALIGSPPDTTQAATTASLWHNRSESWLARLGFAPSKE